MSTSDFKHSDAADAIDTQAVPAPVSLLDQLITPAELASRLGVTERTLAEWRYKGTGPAFIRTGGRFPHYLPADVDEWLLSQRRTSTAEEGA